jgi:hypothetical protein
MTDSEELALIDELGRDDEMAALAADMAERRLPRTVPDSFRFPVDPISATNLVREIQEAVDSADCVVEGHNLWVLIRNEIYYAIGRQASQYFSALVGKAGYQGRVYSGQILAVPQKFQAVTGAPRGNLLAGGPVDLADIRDGVLFVEVPGDYTQALDGYSVNCFADPVIDLMRPEIDRTGPLTKLCRLQPRMATVAKMIDPLYFFHDSIAALSRGGDPFKAFRECVWQVNRHLYENGVPLVIEPQKLEQQAREMFSYRDAFRNIIEECEPRLLFVQNFANIEKFGALMAARELKVKTVDIQHGIQEHTSMYNHHPRHCDDGRYLYPHTLWCWGKVSLDALAAEKAERPTPWTALIEGGHPWKSLVRAQTGDIGVKKLRRRIPKDRKIALYCHDPALINSPTVIGLLPGEIYQAIQESAADVFWLLRLHPRSLHLLADVDAFCREHGLTNVEFEFASTLPLERLMDVADVLITKYSVSALEAVSSGLPVISHSWIGEATFETYRDHPLFQFAARPEDIVSKILSAERGDAPFHYVNEDLEASKAAFFQLLE